MPVAIFTHSHPNSNEPLRPHQKWPEPIMKGSSMTPVTFRPLPIPHEVFLILRGAVQDRDRNRNFWLELEHTEEGEDYITVMTKSGATLYHIRRANETGKPCWLVHTDEAPYEFVDTVVDVANFLTLDDARMAKRSWMTGRSEPGLIVAGELPETLKWASWVGR